MLRFFSMCFAAIPFACAKFDWSANSLAGGAPSRPTLGKQAATNTSVTLTWAAPQDNAGATRVSAYELRYVPFTSCPANEANFSMGTLSATAIPAPTGNTESVTISGLNAGTAYCFILKVTGSTGITTYSPSLRTGTTGNFWTAKTSMTIAREVPVVIADGNNIHVIGGKAGGTGITVHEVYNTATDTWSTKAPLPAGRHSAGGGIYQGKIYFIGGRTACCTNQSTVYEYDIAGDSWLTKTAIPVATAHFGAYVYGSEIFCSAGNSGTEVNTLRVYNVLLDSWSSRNPAPTARHTHGAGIGGQFWNIGGNNGTHIDTNEMYDIASDSWMTKTPMPAPLDGVGVAMVNERIYLVGGTNGSAVNTVTEYNPMADSYTAKAALSAARHYLTAVAVNGKIYAVGGSTPGPTPLTTIEEYTPDVP